MRKIVLREGAVRSNWWLLAVLMLLLGCQPSPPPGMTDPGQIIYLGYRDTYASCARCHGNTGRGSEEAPNIRNAVAELGATEVARIIAQGNGDDENRMPGFKDDFSAQDIEHIIAFITHWGEKDSSAATPANHNAPDSLQPAD